MYVPRYPKELQLASQDCTKLGSTVHSLRSSGPQRGSGPGSCWVAFPKDTHTVENLVASSSWMELWMKQ